MLHFHMCFKSGKKWHLKASTKHQHVTHGTDIQKVNKSAKQFDKTLRQSVTEAGGDQSDTACLSLFFMVLLFIACWLEVSRAAQWCSVNMPHSKAVVSDLSGAFLCVCVGFLPQSRHVHARLTGASVLAVGKDAGCVNLAYSANHFCLVSKSKNTSPVLQYYLGI